jgi:hypothetical protein
MTSDAGTPGTPRFNVVFRGYDRRQVDEHVARLQRVIARMRADLTARSQYGDGPGLGPLHRGPNPQGWSGPPTGPGMAVPPGENPDTIGGFTDRMQRILQSAEEEAEEIRNKARAAARAESDQVRAQLDELVRRREALVRELAQIRGQLPEPPAPDRTTTRLPRPHKGDPPRGAVPSPRPRPTAPSLPPSPPPTSTPASDTAGARSEPPNGNSRFDWPSTPPLWEISKAGPLNGPATERPGRPPTDLRAPAASNTPGLKTAGPITAGPITAGPITAGPTTAGSNTAGSNTAGPITAGSNTAGPITAGPITAGSNTAGPITAGSNTAGTERDRAAGSERSRLQSAVSAAEPPPAKDAQPGPERTDQRMAEQAGPVEAVPSAAARLAASKRQSMSPFNGAKPETGVLFKVPPVTGDPSGRLPAATETFGADEAGTAPVEVNRSVGELDGTDIGVEDAETEPTVVPSADAGPAEQKRAVGGTLVDAQAADTQRATGQRADGRRAEALTQAGDERTVVVRAAPRSGPGTAEAPSKGGGPDDETGTPTVRTKPPTTTSRSG